MSSDNNKGYRTGGSSENVDFFSMFDDIGTDSNTSLSSGTPTEDNHSAINNKEEGIHDSGFGAEHDLITKNSSKKFIFPVLCSLFSLIFILSCVLSIYNISSSVYSDVNSSETIENDGNPFENMYARFKTTDYPSGIPSSLTKAYSVNNELFAWLYIPGTSINTPIVRAKDNTKYLKYNFYGVNTVYGTECADFRCMESRLSSNIVIYGHNMTVGTQFYDVNRYEDIEWYKKHPVIKLTTLYGDYTYLVYTAFYSTGQTKYNGGYFFNYIYPNMGKNSLKGYIQQINERAIYTTGISANENDKFITLSTCNHSMDSTCGVDIDGRLVVVGRLARSNESLNPDTSKAVPNNNFRRPQIWYDRKGLKNPFAGSVNWVPTPD